MRTIFVGDIHGCQAECSRILEKTEFQAGKDRLLLTGDAFNKGPQPLAVWTLIRETGAEMVLGNHDEKLMGWLRRSLTGDSPGKLAPDRRRTVDALQPVAESLLAWLEALPLCITEEVFRLVHAGIHPERGAAGTSREEFLSIRTWPPTGAPVGPRWHDFYTPDNRVLVFGHDALGGLVVKRRQDGRPYLIGLDTGCVYGNLLSAYILEEDRLVQVKAGGCM